MAHIWNVEIRDWDTTLCGAPASEGVTSEADCLDCEDCDIILREKNPARPVMYPPGSPDWRLGTGRA